MIAIFMVSQSTCKLNLCSIFSPFQQNRKLKGERYTFKRKSWYNLIPTDFEKSILQYKQVMQLPGILRHKSNVRKPTHCSLFLDSKRKKKSKQCQFIYSVGCIASSLSDEHLKCKNRETVCQCLLVALYRCVP